LVKKPKKGPKKITNLDGCLIGPRAAFKRYLTMGSDDHKIKAVFSPKSAPGGDGFTFRKEFLNGLQYAVERAVVEDLQAVWAALGKAKRLSHKAFVEAKMDFGEAPAPKEKKPRKKAEKGEKKAPAKKAGGKKKAASPRQEGRR